MDLRKLIEKYGMYLNISNYYTEYSIDNYSIDVVIHSKNCTWYVVEIERALNDAAIGQVIKYMILFHKHTKRIAKPMIVCEKANPELIRELKLNLGIEVFTV